MNELVIRYGAWAALCAAIFVSAGAGFFWWTTMEDERIRAETIQNAREFSTRHDSAVRMHALAVDTALARTRLDDLLDTDVISAVEMLEGAGKAAKVKIQLSDAQSDTGVQSGSNVKAVGFVVSAEGSFASLMRLLTLLETLPLPSSLTRFDLEHTSGGSEANSWRLNSYIRVLTTADISS